MAATRIYVSVGLQRLCLHRFCGSQGGIPVFMVHGSVENGHIFFSESGKGLAPWLAAQGYDVYVADLRGRGRSWPTISAASHWGLPEMMEADFPAMLQEIVRLSGQRPQHWIAHSWGGVMQLAFLARWQPAAAVASLTFFGTKRRIASRSIKKLWMIDLAWSGLGELLTKFNGFLPARQWGFGSDNESAATYRQTRKWVSARQWLDPYDGFDYAAALKAMVLPPALYITGANDKVLGNASDVYQLMRESGESQDHKLLVAGKAGGFCHDYGHVNLLTHRDSPTDVYPHVGQWLKQHSLRKV